MIATGYGSDVRSTTGCCSAFNVAGTLAIASDGAEGSATTIECTRDAVSRVASWITPVPGGVGPLTIAMLLKNLSPDRGETVHFIAFTPTPRLIQVDLVVAGNQRVMVGDQARQAVLYAVKPKLGRVLGFFASLLGKTPTDYACVILAKDVPAFVRCDGALFLKGPIWRIELTTPH